MIFDGFRHALAVLTAGAAGTPAEHKEISGQTGGGAAVAQIAPIYPTWVQWRYRPENWSPLPRSECAFAAGLCHPPAISRRVSAKRPVSSVTANAKFVSQLPVAALS